MGKVRRSRGHVRGAGPAPVVFKDRTMMPLATWILSNLAEVGLFAAAAAALAFGILGLR